MLANKVRVAFISVLSVLILLCTSCATSLNLRITRPAKLDLNGARTIAVLPFKPGKYYHDYDTTLGKQILLDAFYEIFDIKDPDEQLAIDTLYSKIENGLYNSPYIKLVSAESVQTAIKKGTLNPADVYLTGEVSYFTVKDRNIEERELVKPANGDEKAEYSIVHYWVRDAMFTFKYQIVDSSSNTIISSNEIRINESSDKYESKRELPRAYNVIEDELKDAANGILRELQPYKITKTIYLLEAKKLKDKELKKRMKAADKMASDLMPEKASEEFQKIYEETGLFEAGYNASLLQEAAGNLAVAEKMMSDLFNATMDKRAHKTLEDIQYEIRQENRLKKQVNRTDESDDLGL